MNALDALRGVMETAQSTDKCPCVTFDGLTGRDGGVDTVDALMSGLSSAVDMMFAGAHRHATEHAAHVIILAMMVGYSLGVDDTFEAIDTAETATFGLVPESLAGVDFLGDE